jgi:hypothetical protein
LPAAGVPNVRRIVGSIVSNGDHAGQRLKSSTSAYALSAGAAIVVERCTRKTSGSKLASTATVASSTATRRAAILR